MKRRFVVQLTMQDIYYLMQKLSTTIKEHIKFMLRSSFSQEFW